MTYQDESLALEKRIQKKENEEKYHNLILHTSEVDGGEHLYSLISKAYYIFNNAEKFRERDNLIAQLRSINRMITELLDKQGWA